MPEVGVLCASLGTGRDACVSPFEGQLYLVPSDLTRPTGSSQREFPKLMDRLVCSFNIQQQDQESGQVF